jgi:hypothetical protein
MQIIRAKKNVIFASFSGFFSAKNSRRVRFPLIFPRFAVEKYPFRRYVTMQST